MTTAILAPSPVFTVIGTNGLPVSGGLVYTYAAGTTTPQASYPSSSESTPNTNPVVLNAMGQAALWLDPTLAYKINVTDSVGNQIPGWPVDNIQGPLSSPATSLIPAISNTYTLGSSSYSWANLYLGPNGAPAYNSTSNIVGYYGQTPAESLASIIPTNYAYPPLNAWRYGANGSGGSADNTALSAVRSVLAQLSGTTEWQNLVGVGGWFQSAAENTASVLPNYLYPSDSSGTLSVFRFMTQAQIAAVQSGANTTDVSAAVQAANDYLEGKSAGCIVSFTLSGAMSGYTNGFYPCVALTGGHGTNAKAAITVAGGVITAIVPAGPYIVNSSGIATGVAATHTTNVAGLAAFQVGDSLTISTDNTSTDPLYFPSGGSGASVTVASISSAAGKTAAGLSAGGTLFFPPGYYYFGSTPMRIGSYVEWAGNSLNSVQFSWAPGFTGQQLYIGPDESGAYGWVGYYTMGSSLQNVTINGATSPTWCIFADGIQQGSFIRHVNLNNVSNGGIFIKDQKGGVYFKMSDIYLTGTATMPTSGGQPTGVAVALNYGGTVEIDQVSLNGGGSASAANGIFLDGIQWNAGGLILTDYQAEECLNAVDVSTSMAAYPLLMDRALVTNTSFGSPKALWVRSGAGAVVNARGITAGSGIVAIQNDNTGLATPSGSAFVVPSYIWSGTAADYGIHESVIPSGVAVTFNVVSSDITPDIGQCDWIICNCTGAATILAPVYSGNAMPASLKGRKITLTILNNGAGSTYSPSFNSAWHLAGSVTATNSGQVTSADFRWNTVTWYQVSPWTAAVAD